MARENILEAIGDIAREKGIARERLVAVIQEAVTQAAKRKFKQFEDIEARINEESGELEVFRYKTVAEIADDPDNQIPIDEARKLDSLAEPGDEVEYEIDNKELSRVIAQTARQLIFQKIREAERETIFENFKDRVGEVLHGIVSRTERGRTFVTFNQTEAILYRREQIPHERYASGDHMRVILLDVLNDPKEPSQLVISRAHPDLLTKLFEIEVPEIYDGIVEIVHAAREPGRRAKIAVRSNDPDVDAVGACVGLRGSRVQSIISELRGEKIDIIHFSEDLPTFVANALAPAELSRIKINEEEMEIDVEVDPDQLSLAIGRYGQNVRLASKLVDYKINVMSPQEAGPSLEEQIRQSLLASQAQLGIVPGEQGEGTESAAEGESPPVAGEAAPEAGEAFETPNAVVPPVATEPPEITEPPGASEVSDAPESAGTTGDESAVPEVEAAPEGTAEPEPAGAMDEPAQGAPTGAEAAPAPEIDTVGPAAGPSEPAADAPAEPEAGTAPSTPAVEGEAGLSEPAPVESEDPAPGPGSEPGSPATLAGAGEVSGEEETPPQDQGAVEDDGDDSPSPETDGPEES